MLVTFKFLVSLCYNLSIVRGEGESSFIESKNSLVFLVLFLLLGTPCMEAV
jgi:hypothetical protein